MKNTSRSSQSLDRDVVIGFRKLGVIAVIRTGLNFFLSREMREERAQGAKPSGTGRTKRRMDDQPPKGWTTYKGKVPLFYTK